jgi:Tfp pilus assembly protein FimT
MKTFRSKATMQALQFDGHFQTAEEIMELMAKNGYEVQHSTITLYRQGRSLMYFSCCDIEVKKGEWVYVNSAGRIATCKNMDNWEEVKC